LLAGTLVCTAVLTGALIIGDSVRYSLESLVEKRLGKTDFALVSGSRFVRAELAYELASKHNITAASLLIIPGISINPETNKRINVTQVVGVDSNFWKLSVTRIPELKEGEAIISENAAKALKLKTGDEFLLRVENANVIPINTPLVSEKRPSIAFRLKIIAIANDSSLGRFGLRNNQTEPYNVFVSRKFVSKKLELSGLANIILVSKNRNEKITIDTLNIAVNRLWQLTDAGLKLKVLKNQEKFELTSNRIFIDQPVSKAISNLSIPHESILTYLVNGIHFKDKNTPYSFVTAASIPIVPSDLMNNEIIINRWLAEDLGVRRGDTVSLKYFTIGPLRMLKENSRRFIVKSIVSMKQDVSDSSLMPDFPGMTHTGNCRDWDSGIPIDLKQIRDKDEKYWDDFRGTPKAFITMQTGLELWSNQFGSYTAFRFDKQDISYDSLNTLITSIVKPKYLGVSFVSVRNEGIVAAKNSVDFGELFLSLSFFIIAAAVLLIILIYLLNTESRNYETALLAGLGLTKRKILQIRFAESSIVIVAGAILGALAGILYNYGLVEGLNSVWKDAIRVEMLQVYINPLTLIIGSITGIFIALSSILFVTRYNLKQPIVALFSNFINYSVIKFSNRLTFITAITGILGAFILLSISVLTSAYNNSMLFLSAGAFFLIGSIATASWVLFHPTRKEIRVNKIYELALKSAGGSKSRSLTIIMVLAIGTFIIVLTGAYRKTYSGEEKLNSSGTGGFALWAETTIPIPNNLNTSTGKRNLNTINDNDLDSIHFLQLHTLDGDDASCLNLNQVSRPRILGINAHEFDQRGAFSFIKLINEDNTFHPWLEINKTNNGTVIPAFADQTVIQYGLKKSVGDTLLYSNELGETIRIRLIGSLDNSIFQGNILVSDSAFVKLFPSAGSKVILIDAPMTKIDRVADIMNTSFTDHGIVVSRTSDRLAEFNSVENTYLTVFMILGGLGIILGIFGMGIIIYRNLLERRHEMALLVALGFLQKEVFRLILAENILLLTIGIICGILSAAIAVLPSLISPSFSVQWQFLVALITSFFLIGIGWIYLLVKMAFKSQLINYSLLNLSTKL
jgi:ABC-type lipoprotein release transport system permease subunit